MKKIIIYFVHFFIVYMFVSTCNAISIPDLSNLGIGVSSDGVSCAQKKLPEHAAKDAKWTGSPPDCKVSGCEDGYKLSSDGTKCISTPELDKCLNSISSVKWENGKCVCTGQDENKVCNNVLKKCELSKDAKKAERTENQQARKNKKDDKKNACEKSGEGIVKGKWLGASCKCPKGSKLNDGGNCKQNTGTCSSVYGKGKGTYDEKGNCKIKICGDKNYTPNKEGTSCELKTTNNVKEKEENKKTFLSYADKIHTDFISRLTTLQSQDEATK